MLTREQRTFFHEQGYVLVSQVLIPDDLDPLINDFNRLVDDVAQRLYAEGAIRRLYADEPFERRFASLTREAGKSLQSQVSFPVNLRRPIYDFLHSPRLLDAIESLVGPEIYCNPTHHVRPKLPESTGVAGWSDRAPFHQDAAVLLPEADDTLIVTSWIPLVDATEENGTLSVFPGLHRGPIRRHVRCPYGWTIAADETPSGQPTVVPAKKGDVIFIHCRTPHGSVTNRSDHVRWSLDLRWHDARKPGGRPLPGLLARSASDALTSYEDWVNAWEEVKADSTPRVLYRWPLE
jgi:hypothetical protein